MKVKTPASKLTLRSAQASMLSKGFMFNLGEARKQLSPNEFLPLLTWAMTATKKGKPISLRLRQTLYPRTIQELKSGPLLSKVSLDRDLAWFSAVAIINARRINRYLDLKNQYEKFLVAADGEACWGVLEAVETEFGHSIWLIETKIAHLQYFEGVEAQKHYLSQIKDAGIGNVPWLANTFSVRNEEPTTFFRYLSRTSEFLDEVEDVSLRSSLKFQALSVLPEEIDDLSGVFYYETNSALIDVYNFLIEVIQAAVVDASSAVHAVAINNLCQLYSKISDARIERLMFIAGKNDYAGQVKFEITRLVDISSDELATSGAGANATSNSWPVAWRALAERLVASALPVPTGSDFQSHAIRSLCEIYSDGFLAEHTLAETLKWTFAFRWTVASRALHHLLLEEFSSEPVPEPHEVLHRFVCTPYLDPYFIPYLPETLRANYYNLLRDNDLHLEPGVKDIWVREHYFEGLPHLPGWVEDRQVLQSAMNSYLSASYTESAARAKRLMYSANVRVRRLAARMLSACLNQLDEIDDLLELVARTVVADPGATDLLPVPECARILSGKDVRKRLAGNLAVPIILLLNSTHYSDEFDKILAYSYEDFLIRQKLLRPSDLKDVVNQFDRGSLIFYLRYVCVPNIMKVSSVFTGSVGLQDERLAVCTLLLELDEPNAKMYESEIREITRAQIIRSGVRHVEQSKMSIDSTAIRKICDKKLKETFFRYRAMIVAGINPSSDFAEAYMQLLSDGKPLPSEFLKVPTDEAGTLLRELVSAIFYESTNNSMHGLDCYLSMRIRHGALSGQLRGPLELERVITQRNKDSSSYASNEFWLSKLTDLSQTARDQIDLGLCIFSARYDSLIERVTNELVQIHSTSKPNGLFSLNMTSLDFRFLATLVQANTTFDDFFDECINSFWSSVEYCLRLVHTAIESVVKPEINDIFNTLQGTVRLAASSQQTADLDRAVRTAQTNSLQACEQMKDWFKLPTPRAEPLFEVEQLIDIGLQCVQRIHKNFTPSIEKQIDELPRIAGALTIFSDIFFILFDNARKYANHGASPKLWISVKRDSAARLEFSVESEVGSSTDVDAGTDRVEAIKFLISSGAYQESLRSEGGTGLIKLKKIIGASHHLDFGFETPGKFFVKFSLTLREISI